MMEPNDAKVKSLAKALNLLECFKSDTPELGITQLSHMLDLNKSNVSNIVSTFEQAGYLEQNPETGRYRLGLKLLEFSFIINEKLGYQRILHDILQGLSKRLNAITYFAIYRQQQVFYLCNSYPPEEVYNYPFRSIMGECAPLYCTSLGKAMLAYLPQEDFEACLRLERTAYTDYTIMDEDALRREILLTRQRGYSMDNQEHEYGIRCIGVPIFNSDNTLLGAMSASSASFDFDNRREIEECVHQMKAAARVVRERL